MQETDSDGKRGFSLKKMVPYSILPKMNVELLPNSEGKQRRGFLVSQSLYLSVGELGGALLREFGMESNVKVKMKRVLDPLDPLNMIVVGKRLVGANL